MTPALGYLRDHRVQGRALLPGTALLEMGSACAHMLLDDHAAGSAALADTAFLSPVMLPGRGGAWTAQPAVLEVQLDAQRCSIQLHTASQELQPHLRTYSKRLSHLNSQQNVQLPPWNSTRMLVQTCPASKDMSARLGHTHIAQQACSGYFLHPALADNCLHINAVRGTGADDDRSTRIPVAMAAYCACKLLNYISFAFMPNVVLMMTCWLQR